VGHTGGRQERQKEWMLRGMGVCRAVGEMRWRRLPVSCVCEEALSLEDPGWLSLEMEGACEEGSGRGRSWWVLQKEEERWVCVAVL
jgi:hypothetical protein